MKVIKYKTFVDVDDSEIEKWLNETQVMSILSYDKRWMNDTYGDGRICNRYMETNIICEVKR